MTDRILYTSLVPRGPTFISEYEWQDGCDIKRFFPQTIMTYPSRKCPPSFSADGCPIPQYTEWASTVMNYTTSGDYHHCLSHQFSIRLVIRRDEDIDVIIDNVTNLLKAWSRSGFFASQFPVSKIDNFC